MIVILSCGAKKRRHACEARQMYTGGYFKAALAYALAIAPMRSVFVLSAKYGLIGLDDQVEPYDLKMGEQGSVTSRIVTDQAEIFGLLDEKVIALGGKKYTEVCRLVWREVEMPLKSKGGLFKQIAWMRHQAKLINA